MIRRTVRCLFVVSLVATWATAHQGGARASAEQAGPPATQVLPGDGVSSADQVTGPVADAPAEEVLSGDARALTARSSASTVLTLEVIGTASTANLEKAGATVVSSVGSLSLVRIRNSDVGELRRTSGVSQVRPPVPTRHRLESPGSAMPRGGQTTTATGVALSRWHQAGITAAGVKVGIIDIFDPAVLDQQAASGELPVIGPQQRRCVDRGVSCPFGVTGAVGGNAIAEIITDVAPSVTLYLGEVGTIPDFVSIIDWFAANGVTVINYAGTAPYDGPGDGTGPAAAIVDYAVAKGMVWINSVGDFARNAVHPSYGGGYWRGPWTDSDGDRFLEFSGSDESLGVHCGALMGLRWSDWTASVKTDYDLWVSDHNIATTGNGTRRVLSAASQAVAGSQPLEGNDFRFLCNQNLANGPIYDTNNDGFVSLWVQRTTRTAGPTTGDVLELTVFDGYVEHARSDGSASVPFADTRNPGALTIGDVGATPFIIGASSVGPTNDGRAKPDFVASACNRVSVLSLPVPCGGLIGAGAATASAVGLVALASGYFTFPTTAQMVNYFRGEADRRPTQSAWLLGLPKSNLTGWGEMSMPMSPPDYRTEVYVPLETPQRILDTRPAPSGPIGIDAPLLVPPGGTVRRPVPSFGSNYPHFLVVNLTVVNSTQRGFAAAYPGGWSYAGRTANLNLDRPGMTRSNMLVVDVRTGYIDVHLSGGGYVVVDVVGLFRADPLGLGSPASKLRSWPTPGVAFDAAIAASTPTAVPIVGIAPPSAPHFAVPANATSVAVTVTVTPSTLANGFVSLTPGGVTQVRTAIATFSAGKPVSTTALVALDSSRALRAFVSQNANVRIDVIGYFTPLTSPFDPVGTFVPVGPARALDSRKEAGPLVGGVDRRLDLAARGVPAEGANRAWLNAVALGGSAPGTLTSGSNTSIGPITLSYAPDDVIGAASITPLDGSATLLRPTSTTHLVVDLFGYFIEPSLPLDIGASAQVARLPAVTDRYLQYEPTTDGRKLAILTTIQVLPEDTDSSLDAYMWDDSTGELTRHLGGLNAIDVRMNGAGTKFLFNTASSLVPDDGDLNEDLYWYDVASGDTSLALPPSDSTTGVGYFDVSADGGTVAFQTAERLASSDTNSSFDLYVWRQGIGFLQVGPYLGPPQVSEDGSVVQTRTTGIVRFEVETRTVEEIPLPSGSAFTSSLLSADGSEIFLGNAQLFRWTEATGWQLFSLLGRSDWSFLDISDDGRYMLVSGPEGASVVDRTTNTARTLGQTWYGDQPTRPPLTQILSGDGQFVFVATDARNVLPYIELPAPAWTVYRTALM
jgi:hypothetical protein